MSGKKSSQISKKSSSVANFREGDVGICVNPVVDKPLGRSLGWQTEKCYYFFKSHWVNFRQDQIVKDGKDIVYSYTEHPGGVLVVPVTPKKEILLMKSYRYTVDDWMWECPAGGLHDRADRKLEDVARDELQEEAGASSDELHYLGWFYAAKGVLKAKFHCFLALDVKLDKKTKRETGETIHSVIKVPVKKAVEKVMANEIKDVETAAAILMAARFLKA